MRSGSLRQSPGDLGRVRQASTLHGLAGSSKPRAHCLPITELKAATEIDFENSVGLVVTICVRGEGDHYWWWPLRGFRSPHRRGVPRRLRSWDRGEIITVLDYCRTRPETSRPYSPREGPCQIPSIRVLPAKQGDAGPVRSGSPMTRTQTEGVIHVTLSLTDRPWRELLDPRTLRLASSTIGAGGALLVDEMHQFGSASFSSALSDIVQSKLSGCERHGG